jgi:phosphate transport system protein
MDKSKIGHHLSRQFDEELEDIRNKVLTMGGLVEQQIDQAVKSFMTGDMEMAELVIQQDNDINALETDIDQECLQVIAKRQPTAFDLRMLIAVIKTITELERMGDQAQRIAEVAIHLIDIEKKVERYYELEHLAEMVKDMLHGALDAFARLDVSEITAINRQDENVDREYVSIIRQLTSHMMEDPRNIKRTINVLWIARALERISDHACNVCDHVIYMVKGEDVRHISNQEIEHKIAG